MKKRKDLSCLYPGEIHLLLEMHAKEREEVAKALAELICELEKLPGSPQQTVCSTKASALWMKFLETVPPDSGRKE